MNEKSILIVEDESIVALELQTRLQDLGYRVFEPCNTGEKAIEVAQQVIPDLVLMDIMLRGEPDGIDAAIQMKERVDLPIIFLTAYADERTLSRAKKAKPYGYLIKPFQERELRSTIEMALNKHAMEQQLYESEQWLYTTLQSIGDAVIATDEQQRVTLLNSVAESITGWEQQEAIGKPISDIVRIIHENTEQQLPNPAIEALETGSSVALSNHTLLINKEGNYIPIDDSAAPIRNEANEIIGSVLVFKDISDRKQQLQDLRVKNYAIESSINGIIIADLAGTITYVNQSFLDGWRLESDDEVIDKSVLGFWRSKQRAQAIFDEVKNTGFWIGELVARRDDGSEFDVQLSASEVRDSQNRPICMLASVIDISDQKKAERAVRESEEKFRRLFENSLSAVFRSTLDGDLLDCNSALVEMLGFESREEIMQHTTKEFYVDITDRNELLDELQINKQLKNLEMRLQRKDGKCIWVLENINLIKVPEHNTEILVGNFVDITKEKEAQEALQKSEKDYRMIFENMQSGLYRVSPDAELLMVNPQFAEMLEYDSADELVGDNFKKVAGFSDAVQEEFYRRIAEEGSIKNFQSTWRTKNDREITVTANVHEVRDAKGELQYFEGMADDITERFELERQLIQSQKMESLGEIAGGIAHDFNNVMATVSGAIQLLDSQLENEDLRKYTNMIISSIERGKTITNRMLTFTRNDQPDYQPISAMDFLQNVKTIVEHSLPKDIQVEILNFEKADQIYADRGQLQHVLINMCINASHAMPKGGKIRMSIEEPDRKTLEQHTNDPEENFLCLSISDTGHGMDQKTMDHIFEPFYTTKGPGKGTGLGLSVAHKIIRNHQGWITVDSAPGVGTTFTIGLPATSKDAKEAEASVKNINTRGHGEAVLVVDDEESIRALIKDLLLKNGYRVMLAKTGKEALELYSAHSEEIRVVVTDLGLPELPGTALARELHQQDSTLPIIGNTGYLSVNEKEALRELGFTHVVQKPFQVDNFLELIAEVLHPESK